MNSVLKFEDTVVRWLVAEAINYGYPDRWRSYSFLENILGRTRIHKMLFTTFEELKLPVTRSWYRYGGFIHCNALERGRYNRLLKTCFRNDKKLNYYRKQISKYPIDGEVIINSLYENIEDILNKKLDDYISVFYNTAPDDYKDIYLFKNELYGLFKRFNRLRNINSVIDNIENIHDAITNYHKHIFKIECDDINDITIIFTNNIEKILYKIEYQKLSNKKLLKKQLSFIKLFDSYFDKYIWLPCATYISSETVVGPRSLMEKQKRVSQNNAEYFGHIPESYRFLKKFSDDINSNSLGISWNEINKLYNNKYKNNDVDKLFSRIQEINQYDSDK